MLFLNPSGSLILLSPTVGGTILLGIKENTKEKDPAKRFTITGVEDRKKQKGFFTIHRT